MVLVLLVSLVLEVFVVLEAPPAEVELVLLLPEVCELQRPQLRSQNSASQSFPHSPHAAQVSQVCRSSGGVSTQSPPDVPEPVFAAVLPPDPVDAPPKPVVLDPVVVSTVLVPSVPDAVFEPVVPVAVDEVLLVDCVVPVAADVPPTPLTPSSLASFL